MSELRYEKDSNRIATITIEPSASSRQLDSQLGEIVARLEQDDISGAILLLEGDSSCPAGSTPEQPADTTENRKLLFDQLSSVKAKLRRLEKLGKPVVAAIDGSALSRDYQLCLASHYRIATKSSASAIGLPEVTCGQLPAAGGVARLVRLLGLEKALPLLTDGTRLTPEKALESGLVDQLAETRDDLLAKATAWIKANPAAQQPWDQKGYKLPGGTPSTPGVSQMIFLAPAILRKKSQSRQPAPEAILSAAVEGAQVDLDSALRIESRYAVALAFSTAN